MQEKKDFAGLFNIEAEQIVLGKIISNNEYINRVSDILNDDTFYELAHQEIYKYIRQTIHRTSIIADSITLKNFFDTNEVLSAIGGSNYLSILLSVSGGIVDIVGYAKLLEDLSIKRKLVLIGEDMVNNIYKDNSISSAQQQLETAEAKLFNLGSATSRGNGFMAIENPMSQTIQNITIAKNRDSSISGISTGLFDLDRMLGGLQNSDLIILAGRPSMGKTALAVNIAYNAAVSLANEKEEKGGPKKSVGFFSLEMSAEQLTSRILSMETGFTSEKFRKGEINEDEFSAIVEKADKISSLPMYIDDTAALSIAAIRSRARRLIRQENLSLLVIDYLQLIHGSGGNARENRVQEISEITQGLKAIAKEFNIPVIALSQLSRSVEQREDKRPQLSDLRESGSIEQDADIVMFIYRESYYEERKKPSNSETDKMNRWMERMDKLRNKSELIIAKHRNGPIGNVDLYYNNNINKFGDSAGAYDVQA